MSILLLNDFIIFGLYFIFNRHAKAAKEKEVVYHEWMNWKSRLTLYCDGSPRLVVMGGDSCPEGCGFESQHRNWMDILSLIFVVKIVMFEWRNENKRKEGWPFYPLYWTALEYRWPKGGEGLHKCFGKDISTGSVTTKSFATETIKFTSVSIQV